MLITVLNSTVSDKGKYKELDLAYKDQDEKTQGKRIVSFANKEVFVALAGAASGEVYDIRPQKNDRGFWDWVDAVKVEGPVKKEAAVQAAAVRATPKSTYETPEERAAKQVYIVRQNSISNAIEYFNLTGHKKATPEDICDLATTFEAHVFGGKKQKVDPSDAIESMDNDIPL